MPNLAQEKWANPPLHTNTLFILTYGTPMRIFSLLVVLLLASFGCDSGPKLYDISGKVSFDGVPVAKGDITLRPEKPSTAPQGAMIKDGAFQMKANEGKYKVEIISTRLVPGKKGPMGEDAIEEFIPENYNIKTTLSAEVKTTGKNELLFELTSKK
jgi:hypothetical protein